MTPDGGTMGSPTEEGARVEDKVSELEILRQSLQGRAEETERLRDQFTRLAADFDNYRRRSERDRAQIRARAQDDLLRRVVELWDVLDQALEAARTAQSLAAVVKGLELIQKALKGFSREVGLVPIPTVGERVDPGRHEVLEQVETEDGQDGTILAELKRGYVREGRVVRPALVRVGTRRGGAQPPSS